MKKPNRTRTAPEPEADDLRPEYDFDYSTGQPNRFASARAIDEAVTVALAPDVARVFQSSEAVNAVLRALIATMPATGRRRKTPTET